MNDTEIQRLDTTSISGELDGSELARQKRSDLWGRITTFCNEINQTEAVCWAVAKWWRGKRWLMIAAVPVTALFFGVPGMMWAITILCILIYQKTLAKAIRYETASQMCLKISGELRRMMDSSESVEQLEGKLSAMLLQREQLIKMQDGVFEK